jgi:hypothetical protein
MRYKIGDYVKTRDRFDTTNVTGLISNYVQLSGVVIDIRGRSEKIYTVRFSNTMKISFRDIELEDDIKVIRNQKLKSLGI